MRAAFIGNESKIAVYSKLIQNAIKASETDELSICGVMSVNPDVTTNLAIGLNTKSYLSLDDLLKDADIIFVCKHDSKLADFSNLLKEKRVRGKILCHFSSKHDSSVLYCGSTNTYYSIGFPYPPLNHSDMRKMPVSFEGDGKHSREFKELIQKVFPKAVFCTKNEKRLGLIAGRILTEYLKVIVDVSMHIFKISGFYDREYFSEFATRNIKDIIYSRTDNKIRKRSESEIRKDMRLLSVVNYGDTREFYRNMETHIADTGIYSPDEKEIVLRVLKSKST